jgi:hypothetical protein
MPAPLLLAGLSLDLRELPVFRQEGVLGQAVGVYQEYLAPLGSGENPAVGAPGQGGHGRQVRGGEGGEADVVTSRSPMTRIPVTPWLWWENAAGPLSRSVRYTSTSRCGLREDASMAMGPTDRE